MPPPGATAAQVTLGAQDYRGQVGGAAGTGCHGLTGTGTLLGADLTSDKQLWGDGSLPALTRTIVDGVPVPKNHTGAMPPKGGTNLTSEHVAAVAAYAWTLGHAPAGP